MYAIGAWGKTNGDNKATALSQLAKEHSMNQHSSLQLMNMFEVRTTQMTC